MKAIIHGTIVMLDGERRGKALLYTDRIIGLAEEAEALERADDIFDAEGRYVVPGLVDVHIHGYGGADVSDDDPDGVRRMAQNERGTKPAKHEPFWAKDRTQQKEKPLIFKDFSLMAPSGFEPLTLRV